MTSTADRAIRRFAAALLFLFALPALGLDPQLAFVGTMQGPQDALFPGSGTGAYGFVRDPDGTTTYFRVNGRHTRASHIDYADRVVGRFEGLDGVTREFVVRVPRTGGYVEVTLEGEEEDIVG